MKRNSALGLKESALDWPRRAGGIRSRSDIKLRDSGGGVRGHIGRLRVTLSTDDQHFRAGPDASGAKSRRRRQAGRQAGPDDQVGAGPHCDKETETHRRGRHGLARRVGAAAHQRELELALAREVRRADLDATLVGHDRRQLPVQRKAAAEHRQGKGCGKETLRFHGVRRECKSAGAGHG